MILKYILSFLLLISLTPAFSQSCSGSLGDPIINVTFGQGTNPGAPLPVSVPGASTSYTYTAAAGDPPSNTIFDGSYSIINAVPPNPSWHGGASNHTPGALGYMAFFNAAPLPGEFYRQTVSGLCPGTTYEFAAWVLNAINSNLLPGAIQPNITFRIFDPANPSTPLAVFSTGGVPATPAPLWRRYSTLFVTPALNSVILTLENQNIGGFNTPGNDLALDDITFRACGPLTTGSFSSSSAQITKNICAGANSMIYGTVGAGLNNPVYQWQNSTDNGQTWNNVPGANSLNYNLISPPVGQFKYRLSSQEAGNISSPFCRFFSNTIELTVKPNATTTITAAICAGQSFAGHTVSGTYIESFTAANGCDSVRTLNLTVKPNSTSTINASICEGQTLAGYGTTGTYMNTFLSANGCDSVRTLHLIVKPKSYFINNQSICDGQSYQGQTTAGTYISTFTAANGCDSIYTLNLTVRPRSFTESAQSICEGQTYQGYSTSGTYISTFTAANGCDSIHTLHLLVKPKSLITLNISVCQGQSFEGYSATGTYINTFVASNGCDSIRTLVLTVKEKSYTFDNRAICQGQVYQGYNTSGTYISTFVGSNGCDSVHTLNLTVKPLPTVNTIPDTTLCSTQTIFLTTIGDAQSYSWTPVIQLSNPNIASPSFSGSPGRKYYVTGVLNGCSKTDSVTVTVNSAGSLLQPPNKSMCDLDSVMLTGANADNLSYLWNPASTLSNSTIKNPVSHARSTTFYSVKISDPYCHFDSTFIVTLTIFPLPEINTEKSNDINCIVLSANLSATGASSYNWTPTTSLTNSQISNPTAAPAATTTYYVTGQDLNGCKSTDSITLVKDPGDGMFYVPNSFTPNGDKKNDCFRVLVKGEIKNFNLVIFNRWGVKMFESRNTSECWNGIYNNQKAPMANYVYYISATTECGPSVKQGNLVLIR